MNIMLTMMCVDLQRNTLKLIVCSWGECVSHISAEVIYVLSSGSSLYICVCQFLKATHNLWPVCFKT